MKKIFKGILLLGAVVAILSSVPSNSFAGDEIEVPKVKSIKYDA